MKHLLLLITLLLFSHLRAQITLTTSIGLADTYCTVPGDPNNCFNVPAGSAEITYFPGVDEDYLVTYVIQNSGSTSITMISISDTQHGIVLPSTAVNIPVGSSYFHTERFTSTTFPGFNEITATALAQDATGASSSKTSSYILNVVGPEVETMFSLVRKFDSCPQSENANDCTATNYGATSLSIGAGGTIVTKLDWTNTGLSTYDLITVTDQDGSIITTTGFDQIPGQTLFITQYITAPNTPGNYPWSQTVSITDKGGNMTSTTINYTIIVEELQFDVEFGVGRKLDWCPTSTQVANCAVQLDTYNVIAGAGDTIVTRFEWTNTGLANYDLINIVDQDENQITNTGFDQIPGQTLIFAKYWRVPNEMGIHNWSQKLTITDQGGNIKDTTIFFTVEVEGPKFEVEFGVGRKLDLCPLEIAPICSVPYGNYSIVAGAGDTIVTRFQWTNTGLGDYDLINIVDQDDFQVANTGYDQPPGQTLISARFWRVPDAIGTHNWSQKLSITDHGGNVKDTTINFTVIVEGPKFEVEFGVGRKLDLCPLEIAPNCSVPYGTYNIIAGAGDTIVTRFQWTNSGLGNYDLINIVDQDNYQVANTGYDQIPGQTLISARFWRAPDSIGTHNWNQKLSITDQGGNVKDTTINFTVIVEGPELEVEFGVGRKLDLCPLEIAPICSVPYDTYNIVAGAGDTIVTRFQWTNTGLYNYDLINIVDHNDYQVANTGFDQAPGQTLISAKFWQVPDSSGIYNWSQKITITDQGGNTKDTTINYTVTVDCTFFDAAPPIALCKDTTIIISPGQTVNLGPTKLNDGSYDACGGVISGFLDISSFGCSNVGDNVVILTVEDDSGNQGTCTSIVTVLLDATIPFSAGVDQEICVSQTQLSATVPSQGMGMWSIEGGSGGLIGNKFNPNSMFAGERGEIYTLRWTHQNNSGSCVFSDDLNIQILENTSVAMAGIDQFICGDATTITANNPVLGTGQWKIISGVNGSIEDSTAHSTNFNGNPGESYKLVWRIINGVCHSTRDTVEITFYENPSTANSGEDKTICTTITNITALPPTIGIGTWKIAEGIGGSFSDSSLPITDFTGSKGESYKLEWAISNGSCTISRDTLQITILNDPSESIAGTDQTISNDSTLLMATSPIIGVGSWGFISGVGGSIADHNSPNSVFSGLLGETYELEWTVKSGSCTATKDRVKIKLQALPPSTAIAGDDMVSCASNIMLRALPPSIGSGTWSTVDGIGGSFASDASANTLFSGVPGETYTLQWTVVNDGLHSADLIRVRLADTNELIDNNYVVDWEGLDVIHSTDTITIDAMLQPDFNKTLKAGTAVEFASGATLDAGAQLEILIEVCQGL